MFITPLFFSAAVLLVSDVAQAEAPQKFLVIANSTKTFNKLVEILHAVNAFAAILLDDVTGKPGRETVARADGLVEAASRKGEKTDILRRLAKALRAEVKALLDVNQGCISRNIATNPSDKWNCETACDVVGRAVLYLVEAIVKVEIDESKKTQIYKLREDFFRKDFNKSSKIPDYIRSLGRSVSAVMEPKSYLALEDFDLIYDA